MSRDLTPRERRLLIERIARELCFYEYSAASQANYRARAVAVVDGLVGGARSAATFKRAVGRLVEAVIPSEPAA